MKLHQQTDEHKEKVKALKLEKELAKKNKAAEQNAGLPTEKRVKSNQQGSSSNKKLKVESAAKTINCESCSKTFNTALAMQMHVLAKHSQTDTKANHSEQAVDEN